MNKKESDIIVAVQEIAAHINKLEKRNFPVPTHKTTSELLRTKLAIGTFILAIIAMSMQAIIVLHFFGVI